MNARLHCRQDPEETPIGPYTFDSTNNRLATQSEEAHNNRIRFVSLCMGYELRILNTYYRKPDKYLATYRELANNHGHPYNRTRYEQLDYILTPRQHAATVIDVTTDPTCCVHTDHIPCLLYTSDAADDM
eukprot:12407596-Karenia_brevis.AAC.1